MCIDRDELALSERGRLGGVLTDDEQRRLEYYQAEPGQVAVDRNLAISQSSE